jgi:hypothetical protein
MTPIDVDLDRLLKRLNLANTRRVWRDLIARAETEPWTFHQFLQTLVAEEIAHRTQTRLWCACRAAPSSPSSRRSRSSTSPTTRACA